MKAAVWTKFGPPDVLKIQEVPKPVPMENEVLIRVYATTVTAGESDARGLKFSLPRNLVVRIGVGVIRLIRRKPIILGQELAGEIEAIGKDVTRFKVGDQVIAWTALRLGADAEYKCLPETAGIRTKPSNMSYGEAATLPVGGLDATNLVKRAQIRSGEKVLVYGAGGTIGTYAVQIANQLGAVVTAVDSAGKLDMLRSIGAEHVIDYKMEDFTRSGEIYDVVFDVIGKTSVSRTVRVLTPNGRYVSANPVLVQRIPAERMLARTGRKYIPWVARNASEYDQDYGFLKGLIEAGKVRAVVDRCYPLEQIAEAHRYVDTGRKKGHVVIKIESQPEGNA